MAEITRIERFDGANRRTIYKVGQLVTVGGVEKPIRYIEATNVGFDIYVGETLYATVGGPAVDVVYY